MLRSRTALLLLLAVVAGLWGLVSLLLLLMLEKLLLLWSGVPVGVLVVLGGCEGLLLW